MIISIIPATIVAKSIEPPLELASAKMSGLVV